MFIMQMSNIIRQTKALFSFSYLAYDFSSLPEKSLVKKLSYLVCAKDRTTYVTVSTKKNLSFFPLYYMFLYVVKTVGRSILCEGLGLDWNQQVFPFESIKNLYLLAAVKSWSTYLKKGAAL